LVGATGQDEVGAHAADIKTWDTAYEWKAITLLTLAFGLVGLDRWILAPLGPFMKADLGLTDQDLGNLAGVLGVAWGISAMVVGNLSDRLGRRKVLVPAVVIFSILSALSGLATSLIGLVLIRIVMGVAEGPVASTGVAVAVEASHPKRRGLTNGIFQCSFALFGLAIAPIVATQLLRFTDWRHIFMIVGIPGLIVAALMWMVIREPVTIAPADGVKATRAPLKSLFKHRNVGLGMVTLLCAMAGVFVISAMMPLYLIGNLKLDPQQMGLVFSAVGFGGFLGQLGMPALSDKLGRKTVVMLCFALAAVFLYAFQQTGANPTLLFGLLFCACLFNFGALAVIAGPVAAEAAPVGLIASVAGMVIGVGEIFGGGVAPSIAGFIAVNYGLQHTLTFAFGALLVGLLLSFTLLETAPAKAGHAVSGIDKLEEELGGVAKG